MGNQSAECGEWEILTGPELLASLGAISSRSASPAGNAWQEDLVMPTAAASAWADAQAAQKPGLKRQRAKLGSWWVAEAQAGHIEILPVIPNRQ